MALPASQQTLVDALESVRRAANTLKQKVQSLRDTSASGATNRVDYTNLQMQISRAIGEWDQAAAVGGLAQYARDQYADPTLDIVAEYNAMKAAAESLRLWIFNNIPKQGSSPLLYDLSLDGTLTNLTVSSAGAAGFRTEADAFLVTIG